MSLIASLAILTLAALSLPASAWNIPGHMLSGAIAYQVIQQENPQAIDKAKTVLENHPRYANHWQARLQAVPVADGDTVLFMQTARWADDIRTRDKLKVDRLGISSTFPSNPTVNRRVFKPKSLSQ